jgi:hypothetical protein
MMEYLWTDVGLMVRLNGLFDTALVPTVTSSLPLLSNGFLKRTFPNYPPDSATSF